MKSLDCAASRTSHTPLPLLNRLIKSESLCSFQSLGPLQDFHRVLCEIITWRSIIVTATEWFPTFGIRTYCVVRIQMQVSDVQHTQFRGTRLQNIGGGSFVHVKTSWSLLNCAIHSIVGVAKLFVLLNPFYCLQRIYLYILLICHNQCDDPKRFLCTPSMVYISYLAHGS